MFKTIGLIFLVFGAFCCDAKEVLDNFELFVKYEYDHCATKIIKSLYVSKTEKASWAKSHDICKSFGMELATFDKFNEAEFLLVKYRNHSTKKSNVWIGYTDENHEGVWTSEGGKLLDKNISFHGGEPTNGKGHDYVENCLEIWFSNNEYKFNDNQCNIDHHFICEHKTEISYVDELKANLENQKSEYSMMKSEIYAEMEELKNQNIHLQNKLQTLKNSCMVVRPGGDNCNGKLNQQKQKFINEMNEVKNHIAKLENEHAGKDTSNVFADNNQLKIDLQYCNEQFSIITKENSFLKKLDTTTLNCDYEDDGQYYSCNSDDFEIINENSNIDVHGTHQVYKTESDVVEVNFVNCKTKRFSNAIFKHFSNLENLNIVNSSLNYLTQGVFNGAGRLRKLNIQGNNIRAIWYYVFEGAGALNVLKMENNNIESLSTEAFQGLNNLETLSLRNNKIKELPVSIFGDLNKIRYLVFSSNQLQELDAKLFENNKEIRELWFDKNNLTKIGSEIFSYSPYIKRAVFTNNNCINIDSQNVCQEMFKSQVDGNC